MTKQRSRNGKTLLLASGHFYATFADERIQPAIGARKQAVSGSLLEHFHTFFVGRLRTHEQQIFPDRTRKELRVLGNKADFLPQDVEVDAVRRKSVVQNRAILRYVQADQKLHQR